MSERWDVNEEYDGLELAIRNAITYDFKHYDVQVIR